MNSAAADAQAAAGTLPPQRERALLWLLAFTQFTVIMDFMVMMPLGPQIMNAFAIGPAAFATAVSAYAWCAGLSGLLGATYIDRFDRRKLMLWVYMLFALSNLACALAPNFFALQVARAFAGVTAGVLGSVVMAVIGDVIPQSRRGAATGVVMTSLAMAAVFGVPVGILLGAHFGWSSPFYLLFALSALIWLAALQLVPSLTAHLRAQPVPLARVLPELVALLAKPAHVRAFVLTSVVMGSSMIVIPFISPVLVANHGVQPAQLSWLYMAGGAATLYSARAVGRLADRYGLVRVFRIVALFSIAPMLFITHLPALPYVALLALFPLIMVTMSGRGIPMLALMTTVPQPSERGAFLSVNSAVQSLGVGVGAWVGGMFLSKGAGGDILGYGTNGWVMAAVTLFAVVWVGQVVRPPHAGPSSASKAAGAAIE